MTYEELRYEAQMERAMEGEEHRIPHYGYVACECFDQESGADPNCQTCHGEGEINLKGLKELNDAIDQLASEAEVPEVKQLLLAAWWHTEQAIRRSGKCSNGRLLVGKRQDVHNDNEGKCGACDLYDRLMLQAGRVRRAL